MKFVDYYDLLEIPPYATLVEIKTAFKKQAVKWHPDRNLGADTTERMQLINEAYLILKDEEARERYDQEYRRFKNFSSSYSASQKRQTENAHSKQEQHTSQPEFEFDDEVLMRWIRNARRQAVTLAKQTIIDVGKLSMTATKAAGREMLSKFLVYSVTGFILFILFQMCSS